MNTADVESSTKDSEEAAFSRAEGAAFSYEASNTETYISKKSIQESKIFSSKQDLEWDGFQRDHGRTQKFKDCASRLLVCVFIMVVFWVAIGICIYCWHLFSPDRWHFLSSLQLDKMQNIFTGSVISAFIIKYVQDKFNN